MARWAWLAILAIAIIGCTPLPPEPALGGPMPGDEVGVSSPSAVTNELVWVKGRTMIKVQRGDRLCRQDSSFGACKQLTAADRRELDRFFGASSFREKWMRYAPCPSSYGTDLQREVFAVTFSDGATVGRELDAPFRYPLARV